VSKLKFPSTIKVGCYTYKVVLRDSVWGDENDSYGSISYAHEEISICVAYPKSRQINTLLHEIIHACYHFSNLRDSKRGGEEDVATSLANGLMMVYQDNPGLVELLRSYTNESSIY